MTTLNYSKAAAVKAALAGRKIVLCYGGGVDSTALICALHDLGIRPDVITFANTGGGGRDDVAIDDESHEGGEKPETLAHVRRTDLLLASWGWPLVSWVTHKTLASTSYSSLGGNCVNNETLPSLAFGLKSCSIKWKQEPQDQFLTGVTRGPNQQPTHPLWLEAKAKGEKIVKLIGYDNGKADLRRSAKPKKSDANFDYVYPLQLLGWTRGDCVAAIVAKAGPSFVPIKSACYFCPASQKWELFWLAANHPRLFEKALHIERVALTGRHSRFDELHFGDSWEALVKNADSFPSSKTSVGLGRKFAWNQWARVNGIVDENYKVREDQRARCAKLADEQRAAHEGKDNAFDVRSCGRAA